MRVQLNGEILDDNWGLLFEYFDIPCAYPRKVRQAIEDNPAGEDLVVEINSGGGDVVAGFEIYSVLRGANCRTVAEVQSLAGSAASVVTSRERKSSDSSSSGGGGGGGGGGFSGGGHSF